MKNICAIILCMSMFLGAQTSVEQWEVFEKSFENTQTYANPFKDVELTATFKHSSGDEIKIYGFYAGDDKGGDKGTVWKIRFAPTKQGEWTYTCAWSDANAGTAQGGTINCVTPANKNNHGFFAVDPTYKHHAICDDGYRPYILGNTAYHLFISGDWKKFLQHYIDRNFNYTRMALNSGHPSGSWKWDGTFFENATRADFDNCTNPPGDFMWIFGESPNNPNYNEYNQRLCKRVDEVIKFMNDNGMIAEFMSTMPEKCGGAFRKSTMTQNQWREYYKYQMARWGAYRIVWWNFSNEANELSEEDTPWIGNTLEYLRTIDPYKHLRSFHEDNNAGQTCRSCTQTWTEYVLLQKKQEMAPTNALMIKYYQYNKILINAEFNYEGETAPTGKEAARRHWGVAMANTYGCYGDKSGNRSKVAPYFDAYLSDATGPDLIKNIPPFFRSFNWYECDHANDIIVSGNGYAMKKNNKYYAAYAVDGNALRLNLATIEDGTELPYHWYDPDAGTWKRNAGTVTTTSNKEFIPPKSDDGKSVDYVLLIGEAEKVNAAKPARKLQVPTGGLSVNTVDGAVKFSFGANPGNSYAVKIITVQGKVVAQINATADGAAAEAVWNRKGAAAGSYIAHISGVDFQKRAIFAIQ